MSPQKENEPGPSTHVEGSIIHGNVHIRNSQVGFRDLNSLQVTSIQGIFEPAYQAIEALPGTSETEKSELKSLVKDAEEEAKQAQPNQRLLARVFKDLQKMAPDILQVIATTLSNPPAGISLTLKKILDKAVQTAQAKPAASE